MSFTVAYLSACRKSFQFPFTSSSRFKSPVVIISSAGRAAVQSRAGSVAQSLHCVWVCWPASIPWCVLVLCGVLPAPCQTAIFVEGRDEVHDFTNHYHSQLDGVQVCVNKTLAHSDLIPGISLIWCCSIGYSAAVLYSVRSSNIWRPAFYEETFQLFRNVTLHQRWLLPYLFTFLGWRYFLWAQTPSLLERSLTATLSLKVRMEATTDSLCVSFGSEARE